MADELKVTIAIDFANGGLKDQVASEQTKMTQLVQLMHNPVPIVGTTEEVISFGDLATLGGVYMKNLDSANYVEFGPESAGAMVLLGKLKAGERAFFRLAPGIILRMKANTAPVKVQIKAYND